MKNISVQSRKRRLYLLTFYVLIPLVILFAIVYYGLNWWRDYTIKHSNIQTVETNDTKPTTIPAGDLTDPSKPTDDKGTDTGKTTTGSDSTTGSTSGSTSGSGKTGGTTTPPTNTNWWVYPAKMYPTTRTGNDLLVLVNKTYTLSSSYAPSDLVNVNTSGIRTSGGTFYIRSILIHDLKALNTQAKADGIDLSVISSYRSYSQQVSTYNYWVSYNGGSTNAADQISARAGHSQHQLGTAIDFSTNEIHDAIGDAFTSTKAAKWLATNAWKYGFALAYPLGSESITGYSHESWHFRYIGISNAQQWHDSGKILELWLREKNGL